MEDETRMEDEQPPEETGRLSRKRFLGTVAGASVGTLALGGILAACSSGSSGGDTSAAATTEAAQTTAPGQTAANNASPIVIGSPYPLTGTAATDGEQMKGGSGLAVQEINERGGVAGRTIEQTIVDTDIFTPEGVTAAFNQLVNDEVDAIAVGYIIATPPAYDITAPYGAPYLNASTSEAQVEITRSDPEKYAHIFQIDPSEKWYGVGIVPFLNALRDSGVWTPINNKIYILEGDSPYSQTISKEAQAAVDSDGSWQVAGIEVVATGTNDWTPQIQKVRDADPAFVMDTHWVPAELAAFTKQWVANPTQALVYLQYGASVPEFLEIAGPAANGFIWATVTGTYSDDIGKAFLERYQAAWGKPGGLSNAGSGYDEVYMLANAWGVTGDTRNFKGVSSYLKNMLPYRGVNGAYWFTWDSGNVGIPYPDLSPDPSISQAHLFYQIQDQAHRIIAPAPYIEADFQTPPWVTG